MNRRVHLAPIALTSDGDVLINIAKLASSADFETIVRAAEREHRAIFVGVMLSSRETEFAMARLDNAADETAACIVGRRRRRSRGKKKVGT